jgi:5-methylcytosine-specific restriction endonuclease McrA
MGLADVLVLNSSFYAIQVAPWGEALSLLYQGHAEAVDDNYRTYSYDDWVELSQAMKDNPSGFVHTPSVRVAIPDVIRLTRVGFIPHTEVRYTRRNLFEHYHNTCSYCGKKFSTKDLNLDHVIPRSRGGKTSWDNIVLSCIPCNKHKSDRSPQEAGMRLLVKPSRPKWKGHEQLVLKMPFKSRMSWSKFIDRCYWDSELDTNT